MVFNPPPPPPPTLGAPWKDWARAYMPPDLYDQMVADWDEQARRVRSLTQRLDAHSFDPDDPPF